MKLSYSKRPLLPILIIFCCGMFSCKKSSNTRPLDFTYTGFPDIGAPVIFHSDAPSGSTFLWNFGDGNSSSDSSPAHIFLNSDSFSVTLTIDNNSAKSVSKEIFIGSVLEFTYSGNPCLNDTLSFSSNAPTGTTFLWQFGDGATSTLPLPNHQYVAIGTYTVNLVFNNGITDTLNKTITIFKDPIYTHLIAGMRTLHHTHFDYWSNGDVDSSITDTSFSINCINSVMIYILGDTLTYSPSLSYDSTLAFYYSFNNPVYLPKSGTYTLYFNYISNSINYKSYVDYSLGLTTTDVYTTP